jgi:hypothetical protein
LQLLLEWRSAFLSYSNCHKRHLTEVFQVRRDPSRLVLSEQLGRRSPALLLLEIEIAERLAAGSRTTKQASNSSIDQSGGKRGQANLDQTSTA